MSHLTKIVAMADDRRGAVVMIFALAIVPVLGLVGLAIDYGNASVNRARVQTCIDAAVLAGGRAAREVMVSETGTKSGAEEAAKSATDRYIRSSCMQSKAGAVEKVESAFTITYGSLSADIKYQGSTKSFFGALFGVAKLPVVVKTQSKAALPVFKSTYFLIDVSPSMGIASTPEGRKEMSRLSNGYARQDADKNCVFACHMQEKYGKSFFRVAREHDIELRVDTVRNAVSKVVEASRATEVVPGQFKFDITVFDRTVRNVLPMTGDYDAIQAALTQNVTLSTIVNMGATFPEVAIQDLTKRVRMDGDGITASNPKIMVVLATDGVADETLMNSFSKRNIDRPRNSPALIAGACDGLLRTRGKVAVIETVYTKIPLNLGYQNHVAPWYSEISPALQRCASSPSLHFKADEASDIELAFQEAFKAELQALALTQ